MKNKSLVSELKTKISVLISLLLLVCVSYFGVSSYLQTVELAKENVNRKTNSLSLDIQNVLARLSVKLTSYSDTKVLSELVNNILYTQYAFKQLQNAVNDNAFIEAAFISDGSEFIVEGYPAESLKLNHPKIEAFTKDILAANGSDNSVRSLFIGNEGYNPLELDSGYFYLVVPLRVSLPSLLERYKNTSALYLLVSPDKLFQLPQFATNGSALKATINYEQWFNSKPLQGDVLIGASQISIGNESVTIQLLEQKSRYTGETFKAILFSTIVILFVFIFLFAYLQRFTRKITQGNFGDSTEFWNAPDADVDTRSRDALATYISGEQTTAAEAAQFPNTYRYHYIVEITNPTDADVANVTPVKHYTMGRYEHENSVVMPDERTVYLSQDNTNGVFFKFVADNAGDLSSGTLYAAKLTQDAGSNEPATTGFDIEWIELASSDNATIEAWIAEYDSIGVDDYVAGRSSYLTDADAIAWAAGDAAYPSADEAYAGATAAGYETDDADAYGGAVTAEKAMDDRIAFLESRKAARAKGATAEWRKFEGINVNGVRAEEAETGVDVNGDGAIVEDAYVYFAIADLDRGMIDDEGDIQLSSRVKDCGGVYRMKLEAGYDVARIEPVIMGATYRSSLDGAERCDVNNLSQPDNVMVLEDGRILIGEDGSQTNNTLWMYDPKAAE